MKPPIAGAPPRQFAQSRSGFIMIISVIIVGALISVIMVRVAIGSLINLNNFSVNLKSAKIKNLAETCVNEVLLSINRDNAYPGGALTYSDGNCVVSIIGIGNNREITVNAVDSDNRAQSLLIKVILSPFTITAWDN